ncbi:MAG: DICT sensory domain-containing protein, partial [Candidatus Limnocylindrales bacterium]
MAATDMDWTYPAGAGDSGIFEIGRRLSEALGRAPDATRFSYDPRAMLRTTREIEQAAAGGRLLVGFQTAAKFEVEAARYRELLAAGTQVVAWAAGSHADGLGLDDLDYRAMPAGIHRLENQWFLVTDRPEALSFVSYELGDPISFGIGGAASPGKRFVGFISDDPDVIDLLIRSLLPIGAPPPPAEPVPPSASALELVEASTGALDAPVSSAGAGAVVVAVGRGADRPAFIAALALARREGRTMVIVDRSAEGFGSPYRDLRGDDADRPSPDRLFDVSAARREGRGPLVTYLEAA